jgi:hypothetical protein
MGHYDIQRPNYIGTTKNEWEFPTEGSFHTDDLSEIADYFLLSSSGFDDPEDFDDLALPVVNSRGYLSLNGLWAARRGPYSVERIDDIDSQTKADVKQLIDDLGTENFEEFKDVTVTESEWAESTGTEPANPSDGTTNSIVDSSQPSYSPHRAVVGLLFLAGGALALKLRR